MEMTKDLSPEAVERLMRPTRGSGMTAPELKPCPFCGSKAEMIVPHDGKNPYVMCTQNYCTQPHPDCAERWNARAAIQEDQG
jgi:hypothetical protein